MAAPTMDHNSVNNNPNMSINLDHSLGSRRQFGDIFLIFSPFPRKQDLTFLQIISIGDNLHEMSNPVSWENMKIISICHLLLPRVVRVYNPKLV